MKKLLFPGEVIMCEQPKIRFMDGVLQILETGTEYKNGVAGRYERWVDVPSFTSEK